MTEEPKVKYRIRVGDLYFTQYLKDGMQDPPYLKLTTVKHALHFDTLDQINTTVSGIIKLDQSFDYEIERVTVTVTEKVETVNDKGEVVKSWRDYGKTEQPGSLS